MKNNENNDGVFPKYDAILEKYAAGHYGHDIEPTITVLLEEIAALKEINDALALVTLSVMDWGRADTSEVQNACVKRAHSDARAACLLIAGDERRKRQR